MEKKPAVKTYGLIGHPVKHSLSPAMQNAAFARLKINARYRLFDINPQGLKEFLLKGAFSKDLSGFNITVPHKVKAKEILEKKFPLQKDPSITLAQAHYVRLSGAINTVKLEDKNITYRNTDVAGFLRSLTEDLKFQTKGKSVFIFGCGGAGRSVVTALSWKACGVKEIFVHDIRADAVKAAKERFLGIKNILKFVRQKEIPRVLEKCQLLVNASSLGMKEEDPSVIEKKFLHKELFVYDVIYNRETQLVKDARSLGLVSCGGLGMLLYQGALAFEFWTGKTAPVGMMRKALLKAV
ncbi:MAG: shikimate dehydrogenase [Candidatus Omnitrophica bacterium]|nr:shikimate dehydrogenase [Candidatus Omnitrophota bacterium]